MAKTKNADRPRKPTKAPTPDPVYDPWFYLRSIFDDLKSLVPIEPWGKKNVTEILTLWNAIMPVLVRWHCFSLPV